MKSRRNTHRVVIVAVQGTATGPLFLKIRTCARGEGRGCRLLAAVAAGWWVALAGRSFLFKKKKKAAALFRRAAQGMPGCQYNKDAVGGGALYI
jgi:hypothetical protein